MTKYAVLFVLAGLVVGLWLGFNPATHRGLRRWWDNTRTAQAQQAQAQPRSTSTANTRHLNGRVARWLRSATRPEPAPAAGQHVSVPAWSQVAAAWQAFWRALGQIWLNMAQRVKAGL